MLATPDALVQEIEAGLRQPGRHLSAHPVLELLRRGELTRRQVQGLLTQMHVHVREVTRWIAASFARSIFEEPGPPAILPEASITSTTATDGIATRWRTSIERGRIASRSVPAYPPGPKACGPPTTTSPPPMADTYSRRACICAGESAVAGTSSRITAGMPA